MGVEYIWNLMKLDFRKKLSKVKSRGTERMDIFRLMMRSRKSINKHMAFECGAKAWREIFKENLTDH